MISVCTNIPVNQRRELRLSLFLVKLQCGATLKKAMLVNVAVVFLHFFGAFVTEIRNNVVYSLKIGFFISFIGMLILGLYLNFVYINGC